MAFASGDGCPAVYLGERLNLAPLRRLLRSFSHEKGEGVKNFQQKIGREESNSIP